MWQFKIIDLGEKSRKTAANLAFTHKVANFRSEKKLKLNRATSCTMDTIVYILKWWMRYHRQLKQIDFKRIRWTLGYLPYNKSPTGHLNVVHTTTFVGVPNLISNYGWWLFWRHNIKVCIVFWRICTSRRHFNGYLKW